ncbi:uncharacterized protein ACMZJ9_019318 [Mantella aurantiaca]
MKSKPGLGVLLLAALLGAFGFWLSNAAADIFFLLAGETTTHTTRGSIALAPQAKAYEVRTYNRRTPSETNVTEGGFIEETTSFTFTDISTDAEEASPNATLTVTDIYPATTERYNSSTEHLDTEWVSLSPTTVQRPTDNNYGTETVTRTNIDFHPTNLPPRPSYTEEGSVPDITTSTMETDKSICIRTSGLTDAEVLAVVIGAVFLTIVLSAILYQFVIFMRKKQINVDNSIYIIENEHKNDLEANGFQPETRL